jgi:septal ring factor EnvC (AmiA/AmiB activator)
MKKWNWNKRIFLQLLLIVAGTPLLILFASPKQTGGTKQALITEYQSLKDQIAAIENDLSAKKAQEQATLQYLSTLDAKISAREQLILNMNAQIQAIKATYKQDSIVIESLESDLSELREEYAAIIYHSYVSQLSANTLALVFASESLNQAYQRMVYLKKYTDYRDRQADIIEKTVGDLEEKTAALLASYEEQQALLSAQLEEKNLLISEQQEKNTIAEKLKEDVQGLESQIAQKNQQAAALDAKIQEIIAEEIRKAEEAAKRRADSLAALKGTSPSSTSSSDPNLRATPQELKLAASFSNNKGNLPWPVGQGYIVGKFGRHPHPLDNTVYVENNGINIQTGNSADVYSVFEGEVSSIFYIPASQYNVIVRHGTYFTVYSNLSKVYVEAKDKIITRQKIGVGYHDPSDNATIINFQVWNNNVKENPELWLAPL